MEEEPQFIRYISSEKAATQIGKPIQVIRRMVQEGTIRSIKVKGKLWIDPTSLSNVEKLDDPSSVPASFVSVKQATEQKEEAQGDIPDQYISTMEAARIIGKTYRTIYYRYRKGMIRGIRAKGVLWIDPASLQAYVSEEVPADYITLAQAAKVTGHSQATIRYRLKNHLIEGHKVGKNIWIDPQSLQNLDERAHATFLQKRAQKQKSKEIPDQYVTLQEAARIMGKTRSVIYHQYYCKGMIQGIQVKGIIWVDPHSFQERLPEGVPSEYITLAQAAKIVKRSQATIRYRLKHHLIKGYRVGRKIWIDPESLHENQQETLSEEVPAHALTVAQAAEQVGRSRSGILYHFYAKSLKGYKVGSRIWIDPVSLHEHFPTKKEVSSSPIEAPDHYITLREAGKRLGLSQGGIRKRFDYGHIKGYRDQGRLWIDPDSLQDFQDGRGRGRRE